MFYIKQSGNQDCGFTCMSILLANIHKDKNYLFLKHEDRPYTFQELIRIAKKYNTTFLGVKVLDDEELRNCKEFPFVAIIKQPDKSMHSVIVTKLNRNKVYFYDPQLGKRNLQFEEFASRWTKYAMVLKEFEKTKCEVIAKSFVRKKDTLILGLLQIIADVSLLASTFYIDRKDMLYISIILFALFAIFEIAFRWYLLRCMKHIDDDIFQCEIDKNHSKYFDVFKTIQEYKSTVLTSVPSILCSFIIIVFVSVILIMNNYINYLYILLAVALSFIKEFVINPKLKNDESALLEIEEKVECSLKDSDFKSNAVICSKIASDIGYKKSIATYVEITILICASILIMYLSNVANITYIVFYLCASFFLSSNFSKLFEYAHQQDNFDSIQAKLINYLK